MCVAARDCAMFTIFFCSRCPSRCCLEPAPDTHDTCGYLRVYIAMYFRTRTSVISIFRHSYFCARTRAVCSRIASVVAQA